MRNPSAPYFFKSNRLFRAFIGITFFLFISLQTSAQIKNDSSIVKDSIFTSADTTKTPAKKVPGKYHSPKKASVLSAVLPGAGQIYNKKYWKVPVIYAGFAGLAYSFQFNQSRYVKYRNALKYRLDEDASTTDNYIGIYSDEQLSTLYQYYHRYRDLTVIGGAALYLLNIVDAAVDAHLFTFNVSDDLSMNIHPALINTAGNHYISGIWFDIKF